MKQPLRCAVIGAGHFGKLHAQKYALLEDCTLVAVADIDASATRQLADQYSCAPIDNYRKLFGQVDLVSVVTPTDTHFAIASDFLQQGTNVLVEKPVTANLQEAKELIDIAKQHDKILQVGHIEQFNPAVRILHDIEISHSFLRSSRLIPFNHKSSNTTSVILDLMIHDLDLVLSIVPSMISNISAKGIAIFTPETDIANARLEFKDGNVADLSVSRISLKKEMKFQVFTNDSYISIDLINQHYKHFKKGRKPLEILQEQHNFRQTDALLDEICHFVHCVKTGATPKVDGNKGREALAAAIQVTTAINRIGPKQTS